MSSRLLLPGLLVLTLLLAGCTNQAPPPADLEVQPIEDEVTWGGAIQLQVTNNGRGDAPVVRFEVMNGEDVVFAIADVTGERTLAPGASTVITWNGSSNSGGTVLWGDYTAKVSWTPEPVPPSTYAPAKQSVDVPITLLEPPKRFLRVEVDPQEAPGGNAREITVINAGTTTLEGDLTVLVGNQTVLLYAHEQEMVLEPDEDIQLVWDGLTPEDAPPRPGVYQVGAILEHENGHHPATTWTRITET